MGDYVFKRHTPYTKPILIFGKEGSGKTTFAHQIMKGKLITMIDTTYLRDITRLSESLRSLRTHNITQMLSQTKQRGIIFDDIHIFYKEDIKGFRKICEIIHNPPTQVWIVAISHISFMKNKHLGRLSCEKIVLDPDTSERYRMCKHILRVRNMTLTSDEMDQIVHQTQGFRDLTRRIDGKLNHIGDTPETLSKKHMESLNTLENAALIISPHECHRILSHLYQIHTFCDQIETFINTHHHWDMMVYPRNLCNHIADYLKDTSQICEMGNRYISKSMVCTGRKSWIMDISPYTYECIYESQGDPEADVWKSFTPKQQKLLLDTIRCFMR